MNEEGFGQARGILLAKSNGCSVYQFRNDTGDGTMTCYEVFPGAMLSFNDFHVKYFDSEYVPGRNMFVIDHCREGKMEYLAVENAYAYVGAGDIKMDKRLTHTGRFVFPSSHYHGLTIGFDMEIAAAARAAQCEEFILKLPQGYDTPAGEAGKRLSGGEKQRIAIARMMLKNAPIVILDEATAFTDPENEDKIQQSIAALTKGKTLLIIAHRLSTIKQADNIVVLKNGAIVAHGTQEELLLNCPLYQDMWKAHIGAKEWAVSSAGKEEKAYV